MNIAIIPAKGTSRRIPNKNRRPFHGKPILAYSIEAAKASGLFERIVVSTEDPGIASIALRYGAEYLVRPLALAEVGTPDCGTQEVTRHALQALKITQGMACCIYPCAPMLDAEDLRDGLRALKLKDGFSPYAFIAGWYYWGYIPAFLAYPELDHAIELKRPPERWIDINTWEDWQKAEAMYTVLHQDDRIAYG